MASPQTFMVSAPGKVIVFGEHAVVHGKAAMAASISLRSYLHVQTMETSSEPELSLHFIDLSLKHTWKMSSLPWAAFNASKRNGQPLAVPPTSLDQALVDAMAPHIKTVSPDLPDHQRKIHQAAASTVLYLFLILSSSPLSSISLTLRSTIPIGAGLGSSASISVCLSTALLHLNWPALVLPNISLEAPRPEAGKDLQASQTEARRILDRINAFAFLGESLIHGTPSGVDNTVSTLGKGVIYRRGTVSSSIPPSDTTTTTKPTQATGPSIIALHSFPKLPLLIIDTKQAKSTAAEVAKVHALKAAHPVVTDHILTAIDDITSEAASLIEQHGEADITERLGGLITLNHGLLYTLGVSHPRLEELKAAVDGAGAGWFKLTGAGGGGCGFVLLRPEYAGVVRGEAPAFSGEGGSNGGTVGEPAAKLHELERELDARGFEEYETVLGGEGVGILLLDAAGADRAGGEVVSVSKDAFLRAQGRAEIEKLCGDNRSWRYWSAE